MKKYFLILFIFTISLVNSESEVINNKKEIISLIENSWNSIDTMSGRFEQIDFILINLTSQNFPTIIKMKQ